MQFTTLLTTLLFATSALAWGPCTYQSQVCERCTEGVSRILSSHAKIEGNDEEFRCPEIEKSNNRALMAGVTMVPTGNTTRISCTVLRCRRGVRTSCSRAYVLKEKRTGNYNYTIVIDCISSLSGHGSPYKSHS
jgi:hypothetical protein